MCYVGERSVRIREVEGSNPFRSTKMKTVRKGGFHFAVGLRESKFIPPCGGNPFRSTKNKATRRGGFIFAVPCQRYCLTVRPVALCPALWYTAHSYPHIAFIKEDCLCLQCWSAATGGST